MKAMDTGVGMSQRSSAFLAARYHLGRSSKMLQMLAVFEGGAEAQAPNSNNSTTEASNRKDMA